MADRTKDLGEFLSQTGKIDPATALEGGEFRPLPRDANGLSPETAIQESPLQLSQRVDMAFGNTRGRLKYLKDRFEDAKETPDGELVVKQNDLWHRVDPDGFGDTSAYNFAQKIAKKGEEFIGDFVDLADDAIAMIGAGAGAALGSAPGAVAGGAIASAANSSLGRWAGTYEASDEELLWDAGMEALMVAGGYAILPAGKIVGKLAGGAGKKVLGKMGLKEVADAPDAVAAAKALAKGIEALGPENPAVRTILRTAGTTIGLANHFAANAQKISDKIVKHIPIAKKIGLQNAQDELGLEGNKKLLQGAKRMKALKTNARNTVYADDVAPNITDDVVIDTNRVILDVNGIFQKEGLPALYSLKDGKKVFNREGIKQALLDFENPLAPGDANLVIRQIEDVLKPIVNRAATNSPLRGKALSDTIKNTHDEMTAIIGGAKGKSKKVLQLLEERGITEPIENQLAALAQAGNRNAANVSTKLRAYREFSNNIGKSVNDINNLLFGSKATRAASARQLLSDPNKPGAALDAYNEVIDTLVGHPSIRKNIKNFKGDFKPIEEAKDAFTTRAFLDKLPNVGIRQGLLTAGFIGADLIQDGNIGFLSLLTLPTVALASPRAQAAAVRATLKFGKARTDLAPEVRAQMRQAADFMQRTIKPMMLSNPQAKKDILEFGMGQILRTMGTNDGS